VAVGKSKPAEGYGLFASRDPQKRIPALGSPPAVQA
jgi:hypothetical protein